MDGPGMRARSETQENPNKSVTNNLHFNPLAEGKTLRKLPATKPVPRFPFGSEGKIGGRPARFPGGTAVAKVQMMDVIPESQEGRIG